VTPEAGPEPRLAAREALLWALAFLAIAALVGALFIYGKEVRPVLDLGAGVTWPISWS
jgi:hypothetical protein